MSPSPQALEKSLFKAFEISPATLSNLSSFDKMVEPFFQKKPAVNAMRQYLLGQESCPRILGAIVYSTQGRREINVWLNEGMPINLLYHCMLFDGGTWSEVNAALPLTRSIIDGDAKWDFDYKLLNAIDPATAVPGLLEAVLHRAIANKHEVELLKALKLSTLEALLESHSAILSPLIDRAKKSPLVPAQGARASDFAVELVRQLLDPVDAIRKVLLRQAY